MTGGGARPGAGRKAKAVVRGKAVQVKLTEAQKAWLEAEAAESRVSVSEWLYRLLLERGMPG